MKTVDVKTHWREWLMLLFGAWLVVSPFALGFVAVSDGMAMWSAIVMGVALMGFACAELMRPQVWEEWISLLIAAWLLIAPFVLGFTDAPVAMWNSVVMGLLVGAVAIWALVSMKGHGHGGGRPA